MLNVHVFTLWVFLPLWVSELSPVWITVTISIKITVTVLTVTLLVSTLPNTNHQTENFITGSQFSFSWNRNYLELEWTWNWIELESESDPNDFVKHIIVVSLCCGCCHSYCYLFAVIINQSWCEWPLRLKKVQVYKGLNEQIVDTNDLCQLQRGRTHGYLFEWDYRFILVTTHSETPNGTLVIEAHLGFILDVMFG